MIVTRDKKLQTRHIEWMAFIRSKARVIWFRGDRASDVEIEEGFIAALAKIDRLAARLSPPYIIKVTPSGQIELVYPPTDVRDEDRATTAG